MARDAEATKKRILDAATTEFSKFGIAGARVDRIATVAQANKSLIYAYYGNKDGLFDSVFSSQVVAFTDSVQFDAADLAGYVGRAFDLYEDNPSTLRLATWYQLERLDGEPLQSIAASNQSKLEKITQAQQEGHLPTQYTAHEILTIVRALAMSWHIQTPELGAVAPRDRARRRQVVVSAVENLLSACE